MAILMSIFFQLLLLSIVQVSQASAGVPENSPDCGIYLVQGHLTSGSSGVDHLEIHPHTRESFTIALHGLSAEDITTYDGKDIQLKLQIYHSTSGILRAHAQGHPARIFMDANQKGTFFLQKKEACEN